MGKFTYVQNSFKSGMVSQKLIGRTDLEERPNALEKLENFVVMPEGGAVRRSGSRHVAELTDTPTAVFPFIVSKDESYIVTLFTDPATPTEDFSDYNVYSTLTGDPVSPASLSGGPPGINASLEVSPNGWSYAQIADILVICHSSGIIGTTVIARTGGIKYAPIFTMSDWGDIAVRLPARANPPYPVLLLPYGDANVSPNTMTPDGLTGTINIVSAAAFFNANTDITKRIRINQAGTEGVALITSVTSPTVAVAEVEYNFASTDSSTDWALSAFSTYGAEEGTTTHPKVVAAFEQRLIFGGTNEYPDTLWASATGNIFHFMQERLEQDKGATPDDTIPTFVGDPLVADPFSTTPAANQINAIQWMMSSQSLEVGTLGAEYTCNIQEDETKQLSSFEIKHQTSVGGQDVAAVRIGSSTLFVSMDGKRVREFIFNDRNGTFLANNLTVLNSDIIYHDFEGNNKSEIVIEQLVYQQSRDIIWARTSNGKLVGLTLERQSGTAAWHQHTLGGVDPFLISMTTLPDPVVGFDDLWLAMSRTVDSTTVAHLEKVGGDFNFSSLIRGALSPTPTNYSALLNAPDIPWFVDSSLFWSLDDATTLSEHTATVASITIGTEILTLSANDRSKYDRITYTASGTPITGLTSGTDYYVGYSSGTDIKLCTTLANAEAGTFIDISDALPAGTHTIEVVSKYGISSAHLALEDVTVLTGEGIFEVTLDASGDAVIDDNAHTFAVWGLPYTSTLRTLKLESGGQFGPAHNSIQRVQELSIDFYNSYYTQFGRDETELINIPEFSDKDTPYTGQLTLKFPGGHQRGDQVVVSTDEPLPLTVLALTAKGVTYDG